MSHEFVHISREDRVALVRFDRGLDLNPLSLKLIGELTQVAQAFQDDLQTSVVILTGRASSFTAGIDLRDPEIQRVMKVSIREKIHAASQGARMCRAWEEMPQVTVAAIEGFCVGGGVSLALSCDFRLWGRSAYMRVPELELGFNMSWQTLPRLANLVGPARAKRMVLLAERIGAQEAESWGLADWVVEDGKTLEEARRVARRIAQMPPLPVRMTKQAVNAHVNALNHTASFMDADQFTLTLLAEDHREGLRAFLENRKASFRGA